MSWRGRVAFSLAAGLALALALSVPDALEAAPVPSPTLLVLNRNSSGRCEVRLLAVPDGKQRLLFTKEECAPPEGEILWDLVRRRVIYLEDRKVWSRPIRDLASPPTLLAPLPWGTGFELSLDEASGRIRVAGLVPRSHVKTTVEGGTARTRPVSDQEAGGGPAGFPFEACPFQPEPPNAPEEEYVLEEDYVAFIAELGEGRWRCFEARPTHAGEWDAPGLSVLKTPRRPGPGVIALEEPGGWARSVQSAWSTAPRTKEMFGNEHGWLRLGPKSTVVFAAELAYPASFYPPAYLFVDDQPSPRRLDVDSMRSFRIIQAEGGCLLVAPSYPPTGGRVFDGTGRVVMDLPVGSWVGWFPAERLRSTGP